MNQHLKRIERHATALGKCATNYHGGRRQILRQYAFKLSRFVSPIVAVEMDGVRYLVPTADAGVSEATFTHGHYEIDKLAVATRLIEERTDRRVKGSGFLDIGANIGTTSIPAVKTFGASHIWAFEPAPDNLKLLRCNIIANDLSDDITVVPMGLSDRSGQNEFQLSARNWGDNRVVVNDDDGLYQEKSWERVDVQVARFDEVFEGLGINPSEIGIGWIDTQGHEGHVLAGASSLLSAGVPLLTEYWPYGLRRAERLDLYHELVAEHYSVVIDIGGENPVEYPAQDVAQVAKRYSDRKSSYTDLLLLR